MSSQHTHLDILFARVASHGDKPFFKSIQKIAPGKFTWDVATYAQFGKDIETLSAHLGTKLQRDGVKHGAVVGVGLKGLTYSNIVHIYAVARAGYIPNLLSTGLTDPTAVVDLLSKSRTEAFLHEPGFDLGTGHAIRTYPPIEISTLDPVSTRKPPQATWPYNPEGVAFILHTSGSTSGMPKVVPCTNKWFNSLYYSWGSAWNPAGENESQDIFNIPSPVSVATGLHVLLMGIKFGAAFVQSTTPLFSSDELLVLASHGGLNRLNTLAPILGLHIQAAQQRLIAGDDTVYKTLRNMRSIAYGGMPMMPVFEKWAFDNKLPVMNALGSTETGPLLRCDLGENPQCLRPFPGLALDFIPQPAESGGDVGLFKLAILHNSPNIPDVSLRSADGNFYPGDLVSKNDDGSWSYRGRDDDWIKIDAAKLVDAQSLEDFIRLNCSDIVAELVVVGNGRPSLALLAELVNPASGELAKDSILERMATFNARRYTWERLSGDKIIFVGRGILPRTAKGNIRRKAAELKFKKDLDAVYA